MPVTHVPVTIGDVTAYSVKSQDSGLVHYVPNLTGSCTFTLPTPKAGLSYTFMYTGAAADAQNWVITTGSDTRFYMGGLVHIDTDTDAANPVVRSDGNSNSKLTVITPDVGTWVRVEAINDTNWALCGMAVSATIPTLGDQ